MEKLADQLVKWSLRVCPEENRAWFEARLEAIGQGSHDGLLQLFSAAGRKMGAGLVGTVPPGMQLGPLYPESWRAEDLARVAGLLACSRATHAEVSDLYVRGSSQEKRAVLLALVALAPAEQWLDLAVEACRTNTIDVFEAIACHNLYPASYFQEPQLNQLVLKTLFLGLDATQILGLSARITPQLLDDLSAFESERKAAGRSVPAFVAWIRNEATKT